MQAQIVLAIGAVALTCCSSLPSSDVGTPDTRPRRPAVLGTVETLAGPGYCTGPAVREPASESVRSLAVDAVGRVFFETGSPTSGVVAKVDTDGRVSKLVTGDAGSWNGDQGGASLSNRLAPDGQGGVLLAVGTKIIRIDQVNALTTVAGDAVPHPEQHAGTDGSGDGGPASAARLAGVKAIVADQTGGLYIADVVNRRANTVRIRFVNGGSQPVSFYAGTPHEMTVAPGNIATITGDSGQGPTGDAGPARADVLHGDPISLAVAGTTLYVGYARPSGRPGAEGGAGVQVLNLGGTALAAHGMAVPAAGIETVAGGGAAGRGDGNRGDGGQAPMAALTGMSAIAADPGGNLYIAEEETHRVRKLDPSGVITTFAGSGGRSGHAGGFDGNDRPAAQALLDRPIDVDIGPAGRVYISDRGNDQVRMVDRSGVIRAVPGNGLALTWKCGIDNAGPDAATPAEVPRVGKPTGVATDTHGNVYITTAETRSVLRLAPSGLVTTVAGSPHSENPCPDQGQCPAVGDGRPAATARFGRPAAVEVGRGGELYVLDTAAARVRVVNLASGPTTVHGVRIAPGTIATVAGTGTPGFGGDGGPAVRAQLGGPGQRGDGSLVVDGHGNLFIADAANHRVRQVDASGTITTVAGQGAPGARGACCTDPVGVAVDSSANLYVADQDGHRVWAISRSPQPMTVLGQPLGPDAVVPAAGNGSRGLGTEGAKAVSSPLPNITGIAVDGQGSLHIAGWTDQEVDQNSQLLGATGEVRKVDRDGRLSILMGNGQARFNGDGLKGKLTSLNLPTDVAIDRCGNLVVADQGNDRVRRLSVTPCPPLQEATATRGAGSSRLAFLVPTIIVAALLPPLVVVGMRRGRRG